MSPLTKIVTTAALLAMAGCASLPDGPSVMVLPGTGLPFERFRNDDAVCQQYALFQVGGTPPNQAAASSGVASAAVGTALGAAAGAAIGGGSGAAIGAGTGLVGGSIVGTGAASGSMYETQQRFDVAYIQCMYAKGHQVPVSGQFSAAPAQQPVAPAAHIPPPPPGTPPPPPPGTTVPTFPK
ncbi:proline-rich protein [Methyloglobulus morosus KoM1]|uniref:Proline-rich protein n=1 Tax=Methyloglobulus morosus KoM1 TaxID=1116472 RepID=V5E3K9_9GAMM|nr:glycine zipper family protein [Methyloglobulus morosus]ESS74141.1 proline-rich protein [Methyloglobulus morosus KoM1]